MLLNKGIEQGWLYKQEQVWKKPSKVDQIQRRFPEKSQTT